MKIHLPGFFLVLLILLFTSCSITNRRYMPGYQVEWKSKSIAARENAVINKSIEKNQPKDFPIETPAVDFNPVTKPAVTIAVNTPAKPKNVLAHVQAAIKSIKGVKEYKPVPVHAVTSAAPPADNGNEFALKLARQSLLFGIISALITLGFGVVILISVLHNAPALILWIVLIGVVAIGFALLAYFKGRRVLPLLFGDDTMDKYYHMASLGRFLGYTVIICLLLTLVIALAFFN